MLQTNFSKLRQLNLVRRRVIIFLVWVSGLEFCGFMRLSEVFGCGNSHLLTICLLLLLLFTTKQSWLDDEQTENFHATALMATINLSAPKGQKDSFFFDCPQLLQDSQTITKLSVLKTGKGLYFWQLVELHTEQASNVLTAIYLIFDNPSNRLQPWIVYSNKYSWEYEYTV